MYISIAGLGGNKFHHLAHAQLNDFFSVQAVHLIANVSFA